MKTGLRFTRRSFFRLTAYLCAGFPVLRGLIPAYALAGSVTGPANRKGMTMLTPPLADGQMSLEKAIGTRRTVRAFNEKILRIEQLSQIFWAAQGITEKGGSKRAAPSGGALYPADVYAVTGEGCIQTLGAGVYRYIPRGHSIESTASGDRREKIARASLGQMWMAGAPVLFVITAEYERITVKYGDRGIRYALMEIGHIAQNIFLQCQALGLDAGIVGAFQDRDVRLALEAAEGHRPLIIMPVGYKREAGRG